MKSSTSVSLLEVNLSFFSCFFLSQFVDTPNHSSLLDGHFFNREDVRSGEGITHLVNQLTRT